MWWNEINVVPLQAKRMRGLKSSLISIRPDGSWLIVRINNV